LISVDSLLLQSGPTLSCKGRDIPLSVILEMIEFSNDLTHVLVDQEHYRIQSSSIRTARTPSTNARPTMPVEPLADFPAHMERKPGFPLARIYRSRVDGRLLQIHVKIIAAPQEFWTQYGITGDHPQHLTADGFLKILENDLAHDAQMADDLTITVAPLGQGRDDQLNQFAYIGDYKLIADRPDPIVSILNFGHFVNVSAEACEGGFILAKAHVAVTSLSGVQTDFFTWPINGVHLFFPLEVPQVLIAEAEVAPDTRLADGEILAVPFQRFRLQRGSSAFYDSVPNRAFMKVPDPQTPIPLMLFLSVETLGAHENAVSGPPDAIGLSEF
jgi:hypothetical protein